MPIKLHIATFNLMSLDDRRGRFPSLEERIPVLRPQLVRLDADILCLQEVCGQHERGRKKRLEAMNRLLECTPYEGYKRVTTIDPKTKEVFEHHNLVILSRYDIVEHDQYLHEYAPAPRYKKVTALPEEDAAREISWERPILHAKVQLPNNMVVDVINLHLKSRRPTNIQGHKMDDRTWRTASGWAEGVFISSMKRIGQALETRILIDNFFDVDPCAFIAVCGDFNEEFDEVSIEAIRATWRTPATRTYPCGSWCPRRETSPSRHATRFCTTARARCLTTSWSQEPCWPTSRAQRFITSYCMTSQ